MTCYICTNWVPRSREQLENRRKNMRDEPHFKTFQCPHCGGTDYIDSEILIPPKPTVQWDWTIGFREWWRGGWT